MGRKSQRKYDVDDAIKFEGEYLNGKRWKGKEFKNGKLIFEGEYLI